MKKIHIGKTIELKLKLTTNGQNASLAGRDLTVELRDKNGKAIELSHTISNTNQINATFEGKDQDTLGIYSLYVFENKDGNSQSVFDIDAFELVSRTYQEN